MLNQSQWNLTQWSREKNPRRELGCCWEVGMATGSQYSQGNVPWGHPSARGLTPCSPSHISSPVDLPWTGAEGGSSPMADANCFSKEERPFTVSQQGYRSLRIVFLSGQISWVGLSARLQQMAGLSHKLHLAVHVSKLQWCPAPYTELGSRNLAWGWLSLHIFFYFYFHPYVIKIYKFFIT